MEEVTFRRGEVTSFLSGAGGLLLACLWLFGLLGPGRLIGVPLALTSVITLWFGVATLRRQTVRLGPEGIRIGRTTASTVPWSRVRSVEPTLPYGRKDGHDAQSVRVDMDNGRAVYLPAPWTSSRRPNKHYEAQIQIIRDQWQYYAGGPTPAGKAGSRSPGS
jgi:hypothetical protein